PSGVALSVLPLRRFPGGAARTAGTQHRVQDPPPPRALRARPHPGGAADSPAHRHPLQLHRSRSGPVPGPGAGAGRSGRAGDRGRHRMHGERRVPGGPPTRRQIVDAYRQADVFALTPFVTEDGDRDGIPTVLVEAMASGVPVVTTAVAGIPDLVTHGVNGLVRRPHDVEGIAASIAALL